MMLRRILAAVVWLGVTLGGLHVARGDTKIDVEVGWGWRPRADRWTPVFVTASSEKPRNVWLTVEWPQGGSYSMNIVQAQTLDVGPRTFPILVPVHGWEYQQASFTLTDRDSGKTLAHYPKEGEDATSFGGGYPDAASPFVGVSGASTALSSLQYAAGNINIGYLEPRRLPAVPIGFDSLNVLVLNAPNLGAATFGPAPLDDQQQQAIVDWVRTGGRLIIWPGDAGLPANGPLAAVLPAKVGLREDLSLSPEDLNAIGLSSRFKKLASYALGPRAAADRIPMLNNGQAVAYATRLGLGRIVLSPVNISEMQIDDAGRCRNLWRPLLKDILTFKTDDAQPTTEPFGPQPADTTVAPPAVANVIQPDDGNNVDDAREKVASTQIADFLGNVPGAGQIGFSYIAYVLLGLMLVVGPVDWFVLKKLGRQPWTWVTTSGWIALVTTGAIFAGYLFKSGDLHYKTLQTIDQVGDTAIAGTDYVALYSSRTREYEIAADADGWWQPAGLSEYGRSGMKLDMNFHQTSNGNTPEPMMVNVWSLRFLRGDHVGAGPPVLSADLKIDAMINAFSSIHVVGTIRNLTDRPLKNIRVAARNGSGVCTMYAPLQATVPSTPATMVAQISAHGMVKIDAELQHEAETPTPDPNYLRYRYYSQPETPTAENLWRTAADLNARRGKQMRESVATGKFAIVYAETENPPAADALAGAPALEKHYQFIRALVALHDREGK